MVGDTPTARAISCTATDDAGDLGAGHVVDVAGHGLVAEQRRHGPGHVVDVHQVDHGEPVAGHEHGPAELEAAEEDRVARHQRAHRPERVRHAQAGGGHAVGLEQAPQVLLALDLADAVGLARVGVGGVVGAVRLEHRLHVAAAVGGGRRREHEVAHPPGEQGDHRLQVGGPVGGVVEHGVELVAVGAEHGLDGAGDRAVAVQPTRARGHVGLVAVHDRHLVAAAGQFEHEVQPDVPVPTHHEHAHGGTVATADWTVRSRCGLAQTGRSAAGAGWRRLDGPQPVRPRVSPRARRGPGPSRQGACIRERIRFRPAQLLDRPERVRSPSSPARARASAGASPARSPLPAPTWPPRRAAPTSCRSWPT